MTIPTKLSFVFFSFVSACWLGGCTSQADAGAKETKPGAAPLTQGQIPVLEIGMTAAAVREKLGPPVEVKPMDPPEEKAEIWIYHLEGPTRVTQVVTGMKDVPAMPVPGSDSQLRLVQEPQYSTSEQRTTVILELLLFHGRLTAQKSKTETRSQYK